MTALPRPSFRTKGGNSIATAIAAIPKASTCLCDLFMSLIETCRLNGVNSFDYLVELQRHAAELLARPADWMPWNYRATMEARATAH